MIIPEMIAIKPKMYYVPISTKILYTVITIIFKYLYLISYYIFCIISRYTYTFSTLKFITVCLCLPFRNKNILFRKTCPNLYLIMA